MGGSFFSFLLVMAYVALSDVCSAMLHVRLSTAWNTAAAQGLFIYFLKEGSVQCPPFCIDALPACLLADTRVHDVFCPAFQTKRKSPRFVFCGEQDERALAEIKNWKCGCCEGVPASTTDSLGGVGGDAVVVSDAAAAKSACDDALRGHAMKVLPSTAPFLIEQLRRVYRGSPRRHCIVARLLGIEDCSVVARVLKELVRLC